MSSTACCGIVLLLALHSSSALLDGKYINTCRISCKVGVDIAHCFVLRPGASRQPCNVPGTYVDATYEIGATVLSRPNNKFAPTYPSIVRWAWNRVISAMRVSAENLYENVSATTTNNNRQLVIRQFAFYSKERRKKCQNHE